MLKDAGLVHALERAYEIGHDAAHHHHLDPVPPATDDARHWAIIYHAAAQQALSAMRMASLPIRLIAHEHTSPSVMGAASTLHPRIHSVESIEAAMSMVLHTSNRPSAVVLSRVADTLVAQRFSDHAHEEPEAHEIPVERLAHASWQACVVHKGNSWENISPGLRAHFLRSVTRAIADQAESLLTIAGNSYAVDRSRSAINAACAPLHTILEYALRDLTPGTMILLDEHEPIIRNALSSMEHPYEVCPATPSELVAANAHLQAPTPNQLPSCPAPRAPVSIGIQIADAATGSVRTQPVIDIGAQLPARGHLTVESTGANILDLQLVTQSPTSEPTLSATRIELTDHEALGPVEITVAVSRIGQSTVTATSTITSRSLCESHCMDLFSPIESAGIISSDHLLTTSINAI
ncbi:MAG: hypothetical protein AAGA55_03210 [Planctomycetota bacterium]